MNGRPIETTKLFYLSEIFGEIVDKPIQGFQTRVQHVAPIGVAVVQQTGQGEPNDLDAAGQRVDRRGTPAQPSHQTSALLVEKVDQGRHFAIIKGRVGLNNRRPRTHTRLSKFDEQKDARAKIKKTHASNVICYDDGCYAVFSFGSVCLLRPSNRVLTQRTLDETNSFVIVNRKIRLIDFD